MKSLGTCARVAFSLSCGCVCTVRLQACLNLVLWSSEEVGPSSIVNGVSTYVLTQPLPAVGWRGALRRAHLRAGLAAAAAAAAAALAVLPIVSGWPSIPALLPPLAPWCMRGVSGGLRPLLGGHQGTELCGCCARAVPTRGRWSHAGFLGEITFPGANDRNFIFTTQVSIIPNTFPFADCVGAGCKGFLV
jgi:hypothetical protein